MRTAFNRDTIFGTHSERLQLIIALGCDGQSYFETDTRITYTVIDGVWVTSPTGGGSGTPSDTVVTETSYGQSANAGNESTYSRGNHTHGTPSTPAPPVIDHANLTGVTATQHHTNANDPTAGQKAALPGTSGTPGDLNRYVTDADTRNTNARTPTSHAHPESDVTNLVTDLGNKEPANANIQTHVTSAHAPANAQKNSDITKAEIEAKLTGEITSHTHPGGGGGLTHPQVMSRVFLGV